ncbi:maltose acetyltransferase domain-containing protein [Paenibacillus thailandensis]|uniref:Maltose acetyltransferase domain-containing protein n=1 Tax=Paenibacillus thailandensis TaxID=393250 RepID=A0ABW5QUQ7_9BACL
MRLKTEKEKMISGELYQTGDAELVQDRLNARRLTRQFNQSLESDDDNAVVGGCPAKVIKQIDNGFGKED